MKSSYLIFVGLLVMCSGSHLQAQSTATKAPLPNTFLVVLGIAQDGGYPQIGCTKQCCTAYWQGKRPKQIVTSLALVDKASNSYWLFEATPNIADQLHLVQQYLPTTPNYQPNGIFITHAHIGHYTGLMQLGREAMGAKNIPVFAMPRLSQFLSTNGPWSQLVALNNIQLQRLQADSAVAITPSLQVTPLLVPHRDEFSETVGYVITSGKKKILFIPDIDKWDKWGRDIVAEIQQVDVALIDGTFFANGELPGRDMKEIPHPFVTESMLRFEKLPLTEKNKIVFIHFNHTNPLLNPSSPERAQLSKAGFRIAYEGMVIGL